MGQANLAKHLGQDQMRILDAGGGNGLDSLLFAKQGHQIDIVDYSEKMLADARTRAVQDHIQDHVTIHLVDITHILDLFSGPQFDLILCHNVLLYLDDVPGLLKSLSTLLKPNGIISIITINRYSMPYHAAFLNNNFSEALDQLDTHTSKAKIFDADITTYCADEMKELLRKAGMVPEGDYGIRCMCDYWGDNARKSDPAIFAQIERLEFALTDLYPYKLLARFFQVVARKPNNR
ncbi:MAG TPA: methyltransferase domain-containing protein [Anaerolineaceae bacterium]|nr:methyltransferase domain-containing protein [Anaerolineaceae bacterium]